MTYETLSMESFQRNYSIGVKAESFEDPVDLSCKKVPSPSSPASTESDKDSSDASPLRGSSYLEHHEETNNNDSKSVSGYHQHPHHHRESDDKDTEKVQQNQTHIYHHHHHHHESTNYSSSNHERKSPYENRPYMMTPPSDTSSPKKVKFQRLFEHASPVVGDGHPYPSYPILPIGLGGVAGPASINVPPMMPTLVTPTRRSHSPIPAPAATQEPVRTSTPIDDTKKAPRPFKAYPKDPLSITLGPDMVFDQDQKQAYCEFRNRMLESVKRTNEGTNIKMRRVSKSPMLPISALDDKDAAYWERRRKNNEAAKRSRDARRAKEDEIAIRAAFLEQEFLRLKYENSLLKEENTKLSKLVYGS